MVIWGFTIYGGGCYLDHVTRIVCIHFDSHNPYGNDASDPNVVWCLTLSVWAKSGSRILLFALLQTKHLCDLIHI